MQKILPKNGIVIAVIVLFIGICVYPSVTGGALEKQRSRENKMSNNEFESLSYSSSNIEENETFFDGTGDVIDLNTGDVVEEHPNIEEEKVE